MLFQVFHYIGTDPSKRFGEAAFREFPKDYRRVATVEAPELGAVFELTNHIDSNWTTGSAVVTLDDPRARSTSVGDVIIFDDQLHGVAGIGFEALGRLKRCWYCAKPVYDWEVGPNGVLIEGSSCASCRDARLSMQDWAIRTLESSPDAAAEWAIDARMAEAAERDKE